MELIKNLPPRIIKNRMVSFGLFYCEYCKQEVTRRLGDGKRYKSCGCMKQKFLIKHGESYTKLHKVWSSMKKRCLNLNDKGYENYGGRGITICPEWTNDYIAFRDWSLNNGYAEGLQINRINNNGNYEPNNCNWISHKENGRNTRRCKINEKIANEIRDLYAIGDCTQEQLGKKYNLRQGTITKIINKKLWG